MSILKQPTVGINDVWPKEAHLQFGPDAEEAVLEILRDMLSALEIKIVEQPNGEKLICLPSPPFPPERLSTFSDDFFARWTAMLQAQGRMDD